MMAGGARSCTRPAGRQHRTLQAPGEEVPAAADGHPVSAPGQATTIIGTMGAMIPTDGTPPSWFTAAIGSPCETGQVEVAGSRIETLAWGERGRPGLLFVHGMLAHARWWSFIAPFFSQRFRCAALSFSGMGHSGWRDRYSIRTYVDELAAVMQATGMHESATRPTVVAHSFGGVPARRLAEWRGGELAGLVLVDSPVRASTDYRPTERKYTLRPYASIDDATERFRLLPAQECANDYLLAHVSREGMRRQGDHWVRSFDPDLRMKIAQGDYQPNLEAVGCPIAFVRGDRSVVVPDAIDHYIGTLLPDAPRIDIPDAAHHLMLDQPLAFVAALRGLLAVAPAGWRAWNAAAAPPVAADTGLLSYGDG